MAKMTTGDREPYSFEGWVWEPMQPTDTLDAFAAKNGALITETIEQDIYATVDFHSSREASITVEVIEGYFFTASLRQVISDAVEDGEAEDAPLVASLLRRWADGIDAWAKQHGVEPRPNCGRAAAQEE